MVQRRTILNVADNSGVGELIVIHIYNGFKTRFASIGDIVGCVVKKVLPNTQFKKGDKVKVVIVRTRKEFRRPDGTYVRFSENAGVIIDTAEGKNPIGTRIFGPVAREIREKGFTKIASLAKNVI
ncbi:MAG: 50S ribosomal protein L14 [Candidatus Levybacteria bacterium RIFCSPHIGHO2_01_FULL_36_15]|nr:MAG: 50S ribosomal protein L14 [Candidatus Levybacteria bacterium RIFCSPHIGHO2_01_FULL_36_15]OGH38362.1 MAG: 50S ribosomal protein L14 [Candidatus Levybacteria bacterium RIFCSPLOWO2_01_FULL_36_10]